MFSDGLTRFGTQQLVDVVIEDCVLLEHSDFFFSRWSG